MPADRFSANQPLNQWVAMLHGIYGHSQNYSKSSFEILSHLNEVSGLLWPAPGSEDSELGVFMGPEVGHGETKIYAGV
jgi:hypothetical protein